MANQNPAPVLSSEQRCGMAAETTWGTPVTVSNALLSVSISPQPTISLERFTPLGFRVAASAALTEQRAELSFEGLPAYEEIGLFCKTLGNSGSSTVDSYTVAAGGYLWPGAVVSSWTLSGDNTSVRLSGTMLAKWFSGTQGALSVGDLPTAIKQDDISLKIGTTTLSRWARWELSVSDIVNLVRFGGALQPGAAAAPTSLTARLMIEFEANSTNRSLIMNNLNELVDWEVKAQSGSKSVTISGRGRIDEIGRWSDFDGIATYTVYISTLAGSTNALTVSVVS